MKFNIKFLESSGTRFKGWCRWVSVDGFWWCYEKKEFVSYESIGINGGSSACKCRCVRQFKRLIRRNPHIIKSAVLCSGYYGVGDAVAYERS